jgi:putative (di)nucleoside polyphosphate hydrolase
MQIPSKGYRPNVGVVLLNQSGLALIARRIRSDGPEIILPGLEWQMPQGGVDPDEGKDAAARRELWEETGVVSAEILAALPPQRYEFPPYAGPPHRLAAFRGQEQVWYAMRFLGRDEEIDVATSRNGAEPEFEAWRWEALDKVPALVVPFRRAIYARVAEAPGGAVT